MTIQNNDKVLSIADWKGNGKRLAGTGEPPYDGGMETRVAKIEAIIPTLATKEDLAKLDGSTKEALAKMGGELRTEIAKMGGELRTEMHKEFHAMTWKLLGGATLLVSAVYYITTHVK